jgi:ribokinase
MSVLFAGDIGMDTSVVVGHVPEPDEKVVATATTDHVGGVVANAACAAARSGAEARMVCAVGDDTAGREAAAGLAAAGVRVEAVTVPGATYRSLILIDTGGEKRLVIAAGASLYPPVEAVRAAPLAGATWAHTAAYDLAAATALTERCRAAGVPWSVDLEPATIPDDVSRIVPVIDGAAVVFCNARAAARLAGDAARFGGDVAQLDGDAGRLDWHAAQPAGPAQPGSAGAGAQARAAAEGADGVEAARRLLGHGARAVVLTRGPLGVRRVDRHGTTDIRPVPGLPPPVDTTGAGDCLAGWFAGRIAAGDDQAAALAEAVTAASLSCARPGAQLSYPTRAEVLAAGPSRAVPGPCPAPT